VQSVSGGSAENMKTLRVITAVLGLISIAVTDDIYKGIYLDQTIEACKPNFLFFAAYVLVFLKKSAVYIADKIIVIKLDKTDMKWTEKYILEKLDWVQF
jgi:hypothetical protein